MAWQGKIAGVVGSAILSIGIFSTDAIKRIESNPTALYMAGQFWVMAGDRECGIELIDRAARASKQNGAQSRTAPSAEPHVQMCSRQSSPNRPKASPVSEPAARPRVVATAFQPGWDYETMPPVPPQPQGAALRIDVPEPAMIGANFPKMNDFVDADLLVVRNGKRVVNHEFEARIREIEAEAHRLASQRVSIERRKAEAQRLRSLMQRS